ncbi:MAG TPA: G/U mismatch-specific DNA glycosylase [Deltaproteobacteria bacterium]|jgi:TDG/mug DNA glycosylase family protein|nr:G/U mismatch-specific DNA glycosylase [Deltaproteobacteria bacterium]
MPPYKPTRKEIHEAYGKKVPDLIARDLRVLFCGINPGLYSGAAGHHFARPGNRFWRVLFAAGFTRRLLSPFEEHELLDMGYGITNLVERATAGAGELSRGELIEGAEKLALKVREFSPRHVAFLGIQAYRLAFNRPGAAAGRQKEKLGGAAVWVLPSPSGLNAYYRFEDMVRYYRELRIEAERKE